MQTNSSAPWTIADGFSSLFTELGRSLRVHGNRGLHGPLLIVIWSRILRLARRFASIEARLRAGTLVTRPRRARTPKPRIFGPFPHRPFPHRPVNGLPPDMPAPAMPRGLGWLQKIVPQTHMSAGQLCALLQTPEMRALFAEAPQLGKVLRPLAHLLGLRLTVLGTELLPGLELPRRPRKPSATRKKPRPARTRPARPRPKPQPPAEENPWAQVRFHGPPWRTRADAMGIPRKIRD